jgi:D-glycero-alpha-D-manno-heptose 1-phosphate guanylyltransferase
MMQAIVLAGGQGTRLRPVVSDVPKSMAPIADRPFLFHLLERLERQGIIDVVIATGYMSDQIQRGLGSGHGKVRLRYSVECEPLGTGGALRKALMLVEHYPVFALNGDTYLDLDFAAMRRAHDNAGAGISMAVRPMTDTKRYGRVVVRDDRVIAFAPGEAGTPGLINCGVYLFNDGILAAAGLPEKFSFERDFLEPNANALSPLAFQTDGYFIDIGVPEDFARAQRELGTD